MYTRDNFFTFILKYLLPAPWIHNLEHLEDSIEILQMFQIMNPGGWQKVFQYKGKKLSLMYTSYNRQVILWN